MTTEMSGSWADTEFAAKLHLCFTAYLVYVHVKEQDVVPGRKKMTKAKLSRDIINNVNLNNKILVSHDVHFESRLI